MLGAEAIDAIAQKIAELGPAIVDDLPGDWTAVHWRPASQSLACARSPIGVRPLYVYCYGKEAAAATYLPQLVHAVRPALDLDGFVAERLALAELGHSRAMPYSHVVKVLPGEYLVVTASGLRSVNRWLPAFGTFTHEPEEALIQKFRSFLESSVRARLQVASGVRLGLSGGRDSTTLACVAGRLARELGVELVGENHWFEVAGDERRYAVAAASTANVSLLSRHVDRDYFGKCGEIRQWSVPTEGVLHDVEGPNGVDEEAMIPRMVGHGSDHLFDASPAPSKYLKEMKNWVGELRSWLCPPPWWEVMNRDSTNRFRLKRTLEKCDVPLVFRDRDLRRDLCAFVLTDSWCGDARLPSTLLAYPFLDQKIVRLCFSLPKRLKRGKGQHRVLLRKAFARDWPTEVRERRAKGDMSSPVCEAARRNWRLIDDRLRRSVLVKEGWFASESLREWMMLALREGRGGAVAALTVLELEVWLQNVVSSQSGGTV